MPHARDRLQKVLGLTPAEAEFVGLLADGHDLHSASERLGITRARARSYVKRAFEETGTHRQAEFVRIAPSAATAGAVGP